MVLIQNKKPKAQVVKDLQPFLNDEAAPLVDWFSLLPASFLSPFCHIH